MRFTLIVFLFNLCFAFSKLFKNKENAVSIVFESLTKTLMSSGREVSIMIFANDEGVFDKFLLQNIKVKHFPLKIKTKFMRFLKEKKWQSEFFSIYELGESGILLFDSLETLKDFNYRAQLNDMTPSSLKFLIFCFRMTVDELKTLSEANTKARNAHKKQMGFYDDMNDILQHQYFVIEEKIVIIIMTFVWNTRKICHVPKLIEVNRFYKDTKRWRSSELTMEKHENFHGCGLVFKIRQSVPDIYFNITKNSVKYGGYGEKIIKFLSEELNFKYRLNPIVLHFNATAKYSNRIEHYKNLTADLELVFDTDQRNIMIAKEYRHLYLTQLYVPTIEYFAVPPGDPYDAYDKLILPFDLETWVLTMITFAGTFSTIYVIYRMKIDVQNFVFGRNVTTPSLNVIAHFFGLSQVVMPRRSFSRFVVMMFIFLSFMIRNLCQASFYIKISQTEFMSLYFI